MKIAFGSCTKIQNQSVQPVWRRILEEQPDHLLLLGDNVYAPSLTGNQKKLAKRYKQQFVQADFRNLVQRIPYNAIWDDHDFGKNNSKGAHVKEAFRLRSRELFHQWMNCSTNLPHVYHSFTKGEVKFILLDVRFYRQKAHVGPRATVLGAEQEEWLVRELDHPKRYTIVCSGSCLTEGNEKLENYEEFYPRLLALLSARGRTLFLAGDVHENKFVEHDGFFEIISSGAGRDNYNNYGLLTLDAKHLTVELRGERRQRDNIRRTIDLETWSIV